MTGLLRLVNIQVVGSIVKMFGSWYRFVVGQTLFEGYCFEWAIYYRIGL